LYFLIPGSKAISGPRPDTPHLVRILWNSGSAHRKRPSPDNTQHSQKTDIHASGGFRTCNPRKRAAAEPRLRPRGHRDRSICYIGFNEYIAGHLFCKNWVEVGITCLEIYSLSSPFCIFVWYTTGLRSVYRRQRSLRWKT